VPTDGGGCTWLAFAGSKRSESRHPGIERTQIDVFTISARSDDTYLFENSPYTCTTERLDRIVFALFHLGLVSCRPVLLHNGHCLTAVNAIGCDGMTIQVLDCFD
jgi:hypothetical protein